MSSSEAKQMAAQAALEQLPEAGVIGLGSGSTAKLFIEGVGELVRGGRRFVGVATSQASRQQASELGIPLMDDAGPWEIDVCVDGADEVSDELDLIKGGGACQTREKIVNQASKLNIIVVDDSKLSPKLGTRWPIPIEVLQFGAQSTVRNLEQIGTVSLRLKGGQPWLTDASNFVYDLQVGPLDEPRSMDQRLRSIPGVVETGLFLARADRVIVAGQDGVRVIARRS